MFELYRMQGELIDLLNRVEEEHCEKPEIISEIRKLYSTITSTIDSIDREMSEYESIG